MRSLLLVVGLVTWAGSGLAHAQEPAAVVSPSERAAFKALIDDQIAAFKAGDAAAAFRVVAPGLQQKFGSPDRFMQVVRVGYQPVANPKSYRYGGVIPLDAKTVGQWLHVVGPDDKPVDALYFMERQPDGSWRTSGCVLYEPGPERPAV